MRWRFDDMETFVRVVQAGGITSAALQLKLAKSVVSKRIRDLEVALSAQLFHRRPGLFEPTEAGEAFYERIAPLLDEICDTAEGMASQAEVALRGRFRIATPMSFGILYLGPVIADFARQHPGLEIAVDYDDRPVSLVQGGYDVAIRIGYLQDLNLRMRTLGMCARVLCCSPDYAKRKGLPTNVAELAEHDAIDYAYVHATRFWEFEDDQGKSVSVAMRSRIVANNGDAIRDMAIAGLGIATLPIFLAAQALRHGQLIAISLNLEQRPYVMSALYPNSSHVPLKVRTFIDHLIQRFQPPMPWETS